MFLVVLGLSVITFILSRIVPSDPAAAYIGPRARPEQVAQVRAKLGLDKPLWIQYAYYMRDTLHGDFGQSIRTHQPVLREIGRKLPASLELIFSAIFLAVIIGIPLGVFAARWENRAFDHFSRFAAVAGVSIPSFWLGLLLQILFYRHLKLLPLGGRIDIATSLIHPIKEISGFYLFDSLVSGNWAALKAALLHLILPAFTLAAYPIGLIARMTRSTMLEVLQEDYIRTARASGFSERRVMFIYALRNAIGPTLTAIGLTFAFMLTGTFFIELIFYWPGLGTYTARAILLNDYPVIMGITLLMSSFYVVINLVVDLLLAFSDPRIRLE